ncbi:hypothetical protein AcV5_005390 [Taiwanofungus camphoratus]|nr:hypothetical protein AcV5_005390 [Antrodia cinnamomea]
MPGVDDADMTQLVEDKVDAFWKAIEGGASKRGQITVTFSEKRPRKTWFIMGEVRTLSSSFCHQRRILTASIMTQEEIPWEQWIINAEIRQPTTDRDRLQFNSDLASTLTKTLETMLTHASSERGRSAVPLITKADGISPFPIKMTVKVGGVEVG